MFIKSLTWLIKRSLLASFLLLAVNVHAQTYNITANPSSVPLNGNFNAVINHTGGATGMANDFIFSLKKDAILNPYIIDLQLLTRLNPLIHQNINAVSSGSFSFTALEPGWQTLYYSRLNLSTPQNILPTLDTDNYFIQYNGNYRVNAPLHLFNNGQSFYVRHQVNPPGTVGGGILDVAAFFPDQSGNLFQNLSPYFPPLFVPILQSNGSSTFSLMTAGGGVPPGDYVVRYVKVMNLSPLDLQFTGESNKVTVHAATPFTLTAPNTVVQGANLIVNWNGPAQPASRMGIWRLGDPDTSSLAISNVNPVGTSGSLTFTLGATTYSPGHYEVRMFAGSTFTNPIAVRQFEVTAPVPTVNAPATAIAGSNINVTYTPTSLQGSPVHFMTIYADTPGTPLVYANYITSVSPWLSGTGTQVLSLPANLTPGAYRVTINNYSTTSIIAQSAVMQVNAPVVTVNAPATAQVGSTVNQHVIMYQKAA